jgi:hypothetical protein
LVVKKAPPAEGLPTDNLLLVVDHFCTFCLKQMALQQHERLKPAWILNVIMVILFVL